jgi:hypothetical protein
MKGLFLIRCRTQGLVVVVEIVDALVLVLSLLEELSDAFLATRAAIIAGQPVSETTTGTAINQHPIFTNLFIISSPVEIPVQRQTI